MNVTINYKYAFRTDNCHFAKFSYYLLLCNELFDSRGFLSVFSRSLSFTTKRFSSIFTGRGLCGLCFNFFRINGIVIDNNYYYTNIALPNFQHIFFFFYCL